MTRAWWVLLTVAMLTGACGDQSTTAKGSIGLECVTDCVAGKVYGIFASVETDLNAEVRNVFTNAVLTDDAILFGAETDSEFKNEHSYQVSMSTGSFTSFYKCQRSGTAHLVMTWVDKDEVLADQTQDITCRSSPPGITVTGSNGPIADGGADDVGNQPASLPITRTYTVSNSGTGELTLGTATMGTLVNCMGNVTKQTVARLPPGASDTLIVTVTPQGPGAFSCPWALPNNDTENPYDVEIKGIVPAPDLNIRRATTTIPHLGAFSIGNSNEAGVAVPQTYAIDNLGTASISITSVTFGQLSNCAVTTTAGPAMTPLAPNTVDATMMTLSFTPIAAGPFSCQIIVTTNDPRPAENPYTFTITGMGIAPEITLTGFTEPAVDPVGLVRAGVAFTRTYPITNTGTGPLRISRVTLETLTNCMVTITGAPLMTVPPGGSTMLTLSITPSEGVFSCALTIENNDADEAFYDLSVTGTAGLPRIALESPGGAIVPQATDDLGGGHTAGVPFSRSYTIRNTGTFPLTLPMTSVSVQSPTCTNCLDSITQPVLTTIPVGGSTTFSIQWTPQSAGSFGHAYKVQSDAATFAVYEFGTLGVATAAPRPIFRLSRSADIPSGSDDNLGNRPLGPIELVYTVTNDGDANLNVTGLMLGMFTFINCTATAPAPQIGIVTPGMSKQFSVTVTPSGPGAFLLGIVMQTNDPDHVGGVSYTISGTAIAPADIEIMTFADASTDNAGARTVNVAFTRTYVIQNVGAGPLTLGAVTFTTSGCTASVTGTPPSSPVAPSGSTMITIEVTPTMSGPFACTFHIATNDPDVPEQSYDVTISGTSAASIGNFGSMIGNYAGDNGCGIGGYSLENVGGLRVDSFGSNPDDHPLTVGLNPDVASGTGFFIFGVGNHPCTFTKQGNFTIIIFCTSPTNQTCTENSSKL